MNPVANGTIHSGAADSASVIRQDEVNRKVYFARGVYLYYLSRSLLPVEVACFSKYRPYLQGRDVLDIGVGAGRTARHLAPMARRYEAIDYSPVMMKFLRENMPQISGHQADFRDLRIFGDDSFDFVLATANVIDALSHRDRLKALREASRVLRPGGILAFSTHNIHYERAFCGPRLNWSWNPVRLGLNTVQYLLGARNHLRVGPLRTKTPEYALLNDTGHFYSCLHYYVARSTVARQLSEAGMRLVEVFDGNGRAVAEEEDDSGNPWLFYIGQKGFSGQEDPDCPGCHTPAETPDP
jgi:ubiquinone/menaquinone biosynthesis C-methylase UbiE